jgi:F0F1-type ATP synthase assembly protein I
MGALLRILVGKDPREPLLGRASIAAFIALAIAFGVKLTPGQADALVNVLVFVLPAAVAAYTAWSARKKVTPLKDPKAKDGTPLVKADRI